MNKFNDGSVIITIGDMKQEIDRLRAENDRLKSDYKALQSEYRKQNDVEAALVKAIDELSNRAEQAERERDKRDIEQQINGIEILMCDESEVVAGKDENGVSYFLIPESHVDNVVNQLRAQLEDK